MSSKSEPSDMNDKLREFAEYTSACGNIADSVLLVLRAHLYFEYMLERVITAGLKRGDRFIENGRPTFAQKLALVSAFDKLNDSFITALRNMNKVRNKCAHERNKEIGIADVELIGRPLGNVFTEIRKDCHDDVHACLKRTLDALAGGIGAHTHYSELQSKSTGNQLSSIQPT